MSGLTDIRNRSPGTCTFWSATDSRPVGSCREREWPATTVQTCIVYLICHTFRFSGRQHWDSLKRDLKPIYTAPTEATAQARSPSSGQACAR
ncbi:transposase [Rhodococcus sp. BH5]|nr:transposase [Rhodococcus sp. BH5]MCZ9635386.1 transposase [Rhodococcus sp. BH5]